MSRRPLPDLPHQRGVWTTAQARDRGWSVAALRHAADTGRADRLWRGVYAEPVTPDATGRERRRTQLGVAAALTNAGVLVSHLPASALYRWPTWAPHPQACATHDPEIGMTRLPGLHVHRAHVGPADRWLAGSVPVTAPARTVVDIAREYGTEAGLCAADAAAHAGDLGPGELERALRQSRDWPGARNAAPLPVALDPRAESPLETRSRWAMRRLGLPPPMTQVLLFDARTGRFVGRVDFFWPGLGVVGEADGLGKYDDDGVVRAEKLREDALRRLRLGVVRWVWAELERFEDVAGRFWEAVDDQAPHRDRAPRWAARQDPLPDFRLRAAHRPVPLWALAR